MDDVDTDDPMDRDGVEEEDDDRVRGSVMDAVDDEDALLDRNGPCVCVEDEEEDHDSREERVGVRVEVTDRLADDDGDRVRVSIADADDVAEWVVLVVPRSVRVLTGVLEVVLVPIAETEDVDDELALRVPSIVLDDVDDDDALLDAPIVREVVDDAVELRDRMELPVVVTDVHIVCVIRADAVAVRVGRAVHVWSAVDVEVKDLTDVEV